MDSYHQTEGIVLRSQAYRDYDKIFTIFTPQEGLVHLYAKSKKAMAWKLQNLTTPFTKTEITYTRGKGELARFQEGSILNHNLELRDSLERLQAADQMCAALLNSQWPGKEAPDLYLLFSLFLEKLPLALSPVSLKTAFLIKLLKHEGLFSPHYSCMNCQKLIEGDSYRWGSGLFCQKHAPEQALTFTQHEQGFLKQISAMRALESLLQLQLETTFNEKIHTLFTQAMED